MEYLRAEDKGLEYARQRRICNHPPICLTFSTDLSIFSIKIEHNQIEYKRIERNLNDGAVAEDDMGRFDIAVIGTGPAGLSAALTAKARNKNILLLGDKTLSAKVRNAHEIRNYLGLANVSGARMQEAFLSQLAAADIGITEDRINAVYAMDGYFALQGNRGEWEADSVVLATGVAAAKTLPGEIEHLGRGVSYCATCDAALYKGKRAVVLAYSAKEEKEALFLSEFADRVYYLPVYGSGTEKAGGVKFNTGKIEVLFGRRPESVAVEDGHTVLHTDEGDIEADGLFILRDSVPASQLVPGLEVVEGRVAVDRNLKTNIPGIFACGDITGTPYQYIKAAGEGNVAALSAAAYLSDRADK